MLALITGAGRRVDVAQRALQGLVQLNERARVRRRWPLCAV